MPYDEILVESCISLSGRAADLGYGSVLSGRCRRGVVESEAGNSSVASAGCVSISDHVTCTNLLESSRLAMIEIFSDA